MYDLHALLDYLIVEAAVSGNSIAKKARVPYDKVLPYNPDYDGLEFYVEISIYWDGENHGRSNSKKANTPTVTSKKRH